MTPTLSKILPPNPELMPVAMKARPQWVAVKIVPTDNPDRPLDKIPTDPDTDKNASTSDSSTWGTFAEAFACMKRLASAETNASIRYGVGYVVSDDDPYTVIDLDKCVDPLTHAIAPEAMATIERFGSLAEYSGSGTGIHIFVEGKLPPTGRKGKKAECYDSARLVWMTGCPLVGYETIRPAGDELAAWHREMFPPKPERPRPAAPSTPISRDTETVLARVLRTNKGRDLHEHGDWKRYDTGQHQSGADQALCNLYVAAGATRAQADDLFRHSRLFRDKWDERHSSDGRTYGDLTLDTAFDGSVAIWPDETTGAERPNEQDAQSPPAASAESLPDDCPDCADDPCESLRHENLRLRAQLDQVAADRDYWHEQANLLIQTSTHPTARKMAPTLIRAGSRYLQAKNAGALDADGFAPMHQSSIGDDFDDVETPILSSATVGRHLEELATLNGPDGRPVAEVKTVIERIPVIVRDRNRKPIINPETGQAQTVIRPVPRRWARFLGDDLNDILRPVAYARATPRPKTDPAQRQKDAHGGDRRSVEFKASRPMCADCGADAPVIETVTTTTEHACGGCGQTIGDPETTTTRREITFQDEIADDPGTDPYVSSVTPISFQDARQKNVPGAPPPRVARSYAFQDEKRSVPDEPEWLKSAPLPDDSIAGAWIHAQPMPGFAPTPIDHRTDVTIGRRP